MHIFHVADRRYAQFERLRHEAGLAHAFGTRPQDVSPRPGPDQAGRAARRRQMAVDLGLDPDRLCCCGQVHGTDAAFIDAPRPGGLLAGCDAAATPLPGLPLMAFSADCPLVLIFDPRRRVLALVHASWRCTVAAATARMVAALAARYGVRPADLRAGIGPSAGPCCYEVREDVYAAAAALPGRAALFPRRAGRLYFDLWQANRAQLCAAGVRPEHVEVAGLCTLCGRDLFFSYRRDGPGCGHFGLLAALGDR